VTYTVLCGYLLGWVVTSIGLALAVGKLNHPVRPQRNPIPLSVAAGAAWPVVIVGAVQLAIVALVVGLVRRRRPEGLSPAEGPPLNGIPDVLVLGVDDAVVVLPADHALLHQH
jgi:hypothetical protein